MNSDERVTLAADFHFYLEVIVRQKLSARPLAWELFIKMLIMTVITASGVAEHDHLGLCKWKWLFYLPSDFSALLSFCCSLSILPSCYHFTARLCNLWQPGCLSLSMYLLWDRVSSGGAFALFVPWVTNRAPRDFPCLPADSGESRSLLLSASPPTPPQSSGPIQRPRWPARALAGSNIAAE